MKELEKLLKITREEAIEIARKDLKKAMAIRATLNRHWQSGSKDERIGDVVRYFNEAIDSNQLP